MRELKIGDKLKVRPVSFGQAERKLVDGEIRQVYALRTGTVVYIHPKKRFCVLEFQPQIKSRDPYQTARPLRESFLLPIR